MGHTATKLKDFVFPQGPRRWNHIGANHNHAMVFGLPVESCCSFLLRFGRSTGTLCFVAEALDVAEYLEGCDFRFGCLDIFSDADMTIVDSIKACASGSGLLNFGLEPP